MSLNIGDNFKYLGKKFLDERESFNTLEEMNACNDVPKGFITICYEDDKRYEFNGTEWVEYAGGGGGGSTQGGTLSTTLPEYNTISEGDKVNIPYTFTSPNYGEAKLYVTIVNGEASRELEYPIIRQGGGNVSLGTLNRGVNYITMYAVDALAKMTNIVNITIVCGALDINSTFDDGQDYSIYSNISIPINVNALDPNDTMMLHYNIDGNEATMQVYNGFNTFIFPADYKTVGVHIVTLQVIGTGFQSNILEYNIVVCDNTHILLSTKSLEVSIEEGYNVELEYRVSTTNVADYSVVYTLNSIEYLRSKATVGKNKFTGNFKDFPLGDHVLGIVVSSTDGLLTASLNITIHIVPNSFKRIEHATIGLEAYFDMSRNNNNSLTKNELLSVVPTSAGSTAKLVLHDYNYATNGWINGRLVSNGKAWAEMVDYLPLEDDAINGFTFDILFRSDNMGNNYANVIECTGVDSPYMGFAIDSEKAMLTTEVNKLNTYYTDKEDMRITFIVNRTSTYYEEYIKDPETGWSIKNPNPTYKPNPMVQTFVNGIFTDVAMLSDAGSGNNKIYEHIQNTSQLLINTDKNKTAFGNSSIKSIRIYSRPLDHEEVLQNYMADIDDLMEQKAVYDKNYVTVDQDLPTLNFYDTEIGKCDLMTKDTKQWINVVYTSPNPKLFGESFNLMGQTSWQGTSSLAYPTKNYKFKLYDWARDANGDIIEASKWDKSTYTKKKINMYPSEPNGKKENTYCLKADYMDSSHCRNTGTARLVNDFLFDGHPNPAKQVDPQTRDTINGFPCNLYINGRWMGVFNFNHDKSCTKTLGMETIPNTVRWEIKANSDSSAGAFIKTWTNKEECYQAINTDFEIVYDEDAFEGKTGSYDVTKYYDELGFAHEGTVMGTYYDYAILSLARFVNFVSGADETTWKAHISEYCDVEQACRYYLNVMTMGMIDNFAKNCIINMYGDDIWWFSFYDMDSSLGLDNTGYNKFDSNIEPNQPGVYNCSTSRMWVKLNEYSQDDLFNTFKTIREGKYTYENICKYLIEKQIDVIPQLLYNKDMYQKYISQGRQYLHMLHGNNKDHLKRWLYNRFQYVDSLFLQHNSPYTKQSITIRSCAPADAVPKTDSEGNIISPYTARFEIQTYVPQYITVCWRKNTFETKRVNWNETVVFENDMVNSQDNELIVYCANNLKHLGDISGLNPTSIDIGNATRLIEFTCEDSDKLVKADLSKNSFLKRASFRGCSVMGTASGGSNVLDVTGCTNLKELDIRGTQITSLLTNTEGGNLEKILYPEAIQNVVLSNQINLEVIGLPLNVEQDIYAKNLSSVTILNCENVKTLSYPYKEGEPVNFNSLKYVQNLTLSNSIPSLTELSFDGFSKLRNINVYTMPQITSIKFTDLLPATETSTFKTLTLANIPQVDTVSFNVTSDNYKIAFADGAKVDLGNLTSCHTIESNYSIKGLNTLILPITVRNLRFTTEYGDGINDITNIWSHNCNHEGDGFTGLDFADMSIDYIDMTGLSKVTSGINFNLSPIEHNPNLNNGRDGSAEKPYFRPTGTLNLDNYTGDMTNMLKGVDLSKLEVILNVNKEQTDLSYLFYGAIGTNTDVVDRILGRFPNSTVWDYMFATSDRNTDYDLPLRLTSVIGTFKNTAISEYLENWNKTYNNGITATECYTNTGGVLSEIPVSWGGYGLDKNVTSIYVIDTTHLTNTTTFNLVLQDNQAGITDWGDGVTNSEKSHTYAEHGVYTIKTKSWSNGTPSDDLKNALIEVKQIKLIGHNGNSKDYSNAFNGCTNLRKVTAYDLAPTNCQNMFYNCTSLTEIVGLDTWDMSNCTNINGMFQNTSITDPTPVYNMLSTFTGSSAESLFQGSKIESIEFGRFPSSIKNFTYIASKCTNLKTIDFTDCVQDSTNWSNAFREVKGVTSIIGLETLNASDGVSLDSMFLNTNLSNVGTIDMSGMTCKIGSAPKFSGTNVTTIKMGFDWSNITGNLPDYMFFDFNTLENMEWGRNLKANFTRDVGLQIHNNLTVQSLLNLFNTLYDFSTDGGTHTVIIGDTNIAKLTREQMLIAIKKHWTIQGAPIQGVFRDTDISTLTTDETVTAVVIELTADNYKTRIDEVLGVYTNAVDVYFFDDGSVTNLLDMFNSNNTVTKNRIQNVTFIEGYFENCTSLDHAFRECTSLVTVTNIPNNCTSFTGTFRGCSRLTSVPSNGWTGDLLQTFMGCESLNCQINIVNPTNLNSTFIYCSSLETSPTFTGTYTGKIDNLFNGCSKLTSITLPTTWRPSSALSTFQGCTNLVTIENLDALDMSNCTNMGNMFFACRKLSEVNLSNFDTSSCKRFGGMFQACSSLIEIDVSSFDISNIDGYLGSMFQGCTSLISIIGLDKFNTSRVTSTPHMFLDCPALSELDLSNWDFSNINTITKTFGDCTSLTKITLNNIVDTSTREAGAGLRGALNTIPQPVEIVMDEITMTDFSNLFQGVTKIKNDIVFPTNATNVSNCFKDCTSMTHIHSNWKTEYTAMENTTDCYAGCTGITHCDGVDLGVNEYIAGLDEVPTDWGGYGFSKNVTVVIELTIPSDNYTITLGQCYTQTPNPYNGVWMTSFGDGTYNRILSGGNYGKISHTYEKAGTYILKTHRLLYGIDKATKNTFTKIINVHRYLDVLGISEHFNGCTNLIEADLSNLAGIPFNARGLFESCNKLTKVTAYGFKPSNCRNLFKGCSSLTELIGADTWDMSNCDIIDGMFASCSSLPNDQFQVVSTWNVPKVTDISTMFKECSLLTSIDISNFTSLNIMEYAFINCSNLQYVKLGGNLTRALQAFRYCSSLTRIDNFNFNGHSGHYIFHGCNKLSNIEWKGVLSRGESGDNQFRMEGCPLSVNTMVSLFNILAKVTETQTLKLGSTNLAKLTDEQIAIATNKGWTVQ